MSKNLFKSGLDGFGYEILYFVIPITQCIAYAMLADNLFWFSTLLLTSSLLYDSYTRFDRQDTCDFFSILLETTIKEEVC